MNATQIAYLEARIEEERCRKVEEAEATYRRDMEALGVVRGLYERYGDLEAPEEAAVAPSDEEAPQELQAEDGLGPVETSSGPAPEDVDPPDAAGAVEEEQRGEAGEPEPEPVQLEPAPSEAEEPAETEEISGEPKKPCKECGVEKVLGNSPRNHTYKDGHTNRCKQCTKQYQRNWSRLRSPKARESPPGAEGQPEPDRVGVAVEAPPWSDAPNREELVDEHGRRRCAMNKRCVSAIGKDFGDDEPAFLEPNSPHIICRGCRKRGGWEG